MYVVKNQEQLHALQINQSVHPLFSRFLPQYVDELANRIGKSPWSSDSGEDGDIFIILESGDSTSILQEESIISDGLSMCEANIEAVMLYHLISSDNDHLDVYHIIILQNNESALNIFTTTATLDEEEEDFLAEQASYLPEMEFRV